MHLEIGKLARSPERFIQTYSFNTFLETIYEYNIM